MRNELDIEPILQILPYRWPVMMLDLVHHTNVLKLSGEASVEGMLCVQAELLRVVDRGE